VELAGGARITPDQLLAYAAGLLAPYKRPSEIITMGALPTAANGKVLKGRLAHLARDA